MKHFSLLTINSENPIRKSRTHTSCCTLSPSSTGTFLGASDFDDQFLINPYATYIWHYLFIFLIVFMVINMVVAIVVESFEENFEFRSKNPYLEDSIIKTGVIYIIVQLTPITTRLGIRQVLLLLVGVMLLTVTAVVMTIIVWNGFAVLTPSSASMISTSGSISKMTRRLVRASAYSFMLTS